MSREEALSPGAWAATAERRAALVEDGWQIRLGKGATLRLGPTWVAERKHSRGTTTLYGDDLVALLEQVDLRIHHRRKEEVHV